MKILLVCPTEMEYRTMRDTLKVVQHSNTYQCLHTGVGKSNSAASVAVEISSRQYDLIAVIGYAAGSSQFTQGELVMPTKCKFHDVKVPEDLLPELVQMFTLEGSDKVLCLTGDVFVDAEYEKFLGISHKCIYDMEAASVALVAQDYDVPVLVAKYISDVPSKGHSALTFEEFAKSKKSFKEILIYLEELYRIR